MNTSIASRPLLEESSPVKESIALSTNITLEAGRISTAKTTYIHTNLPLEICPAHPHTYRQLILPIPPERLTLLSRLLPEVGVTTVLTGIGSNRSFNSLLSWKRDSKMELRSESPSISAQKLFHTKLHSSRSWLFTRVLE